MNGPVPQQPAAGSALLSINAGSSSLKFAWFERDAGWDYGSLPVPLLRGEIDLHDGHPQLRYALAGQGQRMLVPGVTRGNIGAETAWLVEWIQRELGLARPAIVAHRIVHGGLRHARAVRIDERVETELHRLISLAPLHQGPGLDGVRAARLALPDAVQVACFDTAFHAAHADSERRYAIPRRWHERGYQHYGFHGLSFDAVARRLPALLGQRAQGCVVVAHLGSGASVCGMRELRSLSTSMGFTALDGLVMSTRCGSIDPGVLLRWMQHDRLTARQISDMLYHESGLLGVSEISSDMRELLGSSDERARQAVELFVAAAVRHVGATAASIGGLDALVFTGGIGTHQAPIRAAISRRMGWLGVELDEAANEAGHGLVSDTGSRVPVLVLPTDEEAVMALQAVEACGTPEQAAATGMEAA